ncbi:MAG TPA: hypothetical protein VHM00_15515 [Caldimonas sp.]|jgi:hypothetical protein|nr:hypothetical protein [Caldimonas sp.]HEX2542479.1 hypothetical protein [Caldimonas sp.]
MIPAVQPVTRFASIALLAVLLHLGGCSVSTSVRGQVIDQTETFKGTATGYFNGRGTLEVVSSHGLSCSGTFKYLDMSHGQGFFTCQDGRDGPFEFTSSGMSGVGYGYVGEARVEFTFGE